MPNEAEFSHFFKKIVREGGEITREQFVQYEEVASLLRDGLISNEDITDLWASVAADAYGLTEDEAYEMLCMVIDLPDPEEVKFLDDEFMKLSGEKGSVSFVGVMNWEDIKSIVDDEALSIEELSNIWRDVAGDLNSKINKKQFIKFNRVVDDALEAKEGNINSTDGPEADSTTTEADKDLTTYVSPVILSSAEVWTPSFDPKTVFEDDMLTEVTEYFISTAGSIAGQISFAQFMEWPDVQNSLADKTLTREALQLAWAEAASELESSIDYDTFLRLNVRLDLLMDEIEEGSGPVVEPPATESAHALDPALTAAPTTAAPIQDDGKQGQQMNDAQNAENFYRSEFQKLTGSGQLLPLTGLLDWNEIAELVLDGAVTENQIARLFEGMPKEPMLGTALGSASGGGGGVMGISEDSFVALNSMLDVLIDATAPVGQSATQTAAAPAALVSEPPRPMPSQNRELKMGSLSDLSGSPTASIADAGSAASLSGEELDLMERLDQADSMLNSGSFGDFDQMIGDVDDPRLAALREEREGAQEVSGALQDNLRELLELGRKQVRCGLELPTEEVAARLRDLIQGVLEKAPELAESASVDDIRRLVSGRWKLLYTNSEMFGFYNGVTGLTNVFPATKFEDLSVEYASDGYLSEARYHESLSTPLGPLPATVMGNWDLVKEVSFMTNKNSVVLRNYCTKVTAGPMEYEAQENWKSLRTLAMNEVVYVDDRVMISRNCGALRIYFVFERE